MPRMISRHALLLAPILTLSAVTAMAEEKPGDGFAGVYPTSKHYTPPRDPEALAMPARFQDLKFGFFMHRGGVQPVGNRCLLVALPGAS